MKVFESILLLLWGVLMACSQNKENLNEKELKSELQRLKVTPDKGGIEKDVEASEVDSVWSMPYYTASLTDWESYFRTNNKYKNWDSKDEKMVLINAIIEKDSTATQVKVVGKGCGVKELEEEAVRLIKAAKVSPASDEHGNLLRSNWFIPVYFPPR